MDRFLDANDFSAAVVGELKEHQNIAKVLDAGSTSGGSPYFVMELVKGIRLTDYCDSNKLSVKERLELFVPVCKAIQHAHQKRASSIEI